jgi:hypothetical protein
MASRNKPQDKNMEGAVEKEGHLLFCGLEKMHGASKEKQKYFNLYSYLSGQLHTDKHQLVKISDGKAKGFISEDAFAQFFENLEQENQTIVYVQPDMPDKNDKPDSKKYIDFAYFADVVEKHPDYLSARFANSLRQWAAVKAGSKQ